MCSGTQLRKHVNLVFENFSKWQTREVVGRETNIRKGTVIIIITMCAKHLVFSGFDHKGSSNTTC
jgi:hypothetical protein